MKRLTKRWGEQPYPNLAGKVVCEYKECDSAKSCNDCIHGRIMQRLAAIEDILGDEYELDDVAPVRRGHWKYYHKQNKAVCTNCSFERDLSADFGAAIACPNCGAKMN